MSSYLNNDCRETDMFVIILGDRQPSMVGNIGKVYVINLSLTTF